jgi:hypothetical protein
MKPLKSYFAVLLFVLALVAFPFAGFCQEAGFKITEMAVTTKIVRGNPIDSVHRISSASVKALYCFTRIRSTEELNTTIRHIWYRDNVKVGEYELPVKGMTWRTFSKKMVDKGMAGDWRVECLDISGKVLKTVSFRMN